MEPQWIDYRAWHYDKKVMMHVSEIDFLKDRVKGMTKDGITIDASFLDVALMPWTTYYDDSYDDVMIYEGDIVEVTNKDMKTQFVIDNEMGVLLARRLGDDPRLSVMLDLDALSDYGRIKVIGNGFENQELLKKKE